MLTVRHEILANNLVKIPGIQSRTCLEARIFTTPNDTSPASTVRGNTREGFLDMYSTALAYLTAQCYTINEDNTLEPLPSTGVENVEFFADEILMIPLLGDVSVRFRSLGGKLTDALQHLG